MVDMKAVPFSTPDSDNIAKTLLYDFSTRSCYRSRGNKPPRITSAIVGTMYLFRNLLAVSSTRQGRPALLCDVLNHKSYTVL